MASGHKFPPWRRAILVPFWTLQLALMLGIIALLALATGVLATQYDKNKDYGFANDAEVDAAVDAATKVVAPVWISLSVFCMILTITEIILLTRRKLTPLKFLIFNVIKSAIWTALFIMDIVAWASSTGRSQTIGGVFIEGGVVLSFWIPLIYGSIVYHKFRREKKSYKPVSHPLSTPSGVHDTSYPSHVPIQAHRDVEVGGPPAYRGQVTGTTGGTVPPYDPYKSGQSYGDVGLAHDSPRIMSPGVPQVYVQHHDVYEMDSRRNLA